MIKKRFRKTIITIISISLTGLAGLGCKGDVFSTLTSTTFATLFTVTSTIDNYAAVQIISITSTTPDGSYCVGRDIDVTVQFSKPVTLSGGTLDVTLNTGHAVSVSAASYPSAVLTGTYTVQRGDYSADLDSTVVSSNGAIRDHLDRDVTIALPFSTIARTKDIVIDGRVPTILEVTSSSDNRLYKIGEDINITINFSRPVTLSGGPLMVVLDTGATVPMSSAAYPSSGLTGTYTVGTGDDSPDLDSTGVSLLTGTLQDPVGNEADLGIPSEESLAYNKDIVVDGLQGYIRSVTSSSANGMYGRDLDVDITVEFNEPVTLAGGNLFVTLETGSDDAIVAITPFANSNQAHGTYTVRNGDLSGDLDSTGISLEGGATLRDKADYDVLPANPSGQTLAVNKEIQVNGNSPFITTITSESDSRAYRLGESIDITVHFSENVTLADGTLDATLETGAADAVVHIAPFTNADHAHAIYVVGTGHQSPDLDAIDIDKVGGSVPLRSAITGNDVIVALPGSRFVSKDIAVDGILPYISSITSSTADGTYGVGASINVTVNFSENVALSGGTIDIPLNTGTTVTITDFGPSGSASGTYTVAAGQSTGDLTATGISVGTGTLRDPAGNDATVSIPADENLGDNKAIVIDGILPVITAAETLDTNGNGRIDHYRVIFNRNINDSTFDPAQWMVAGYGNIRLDISSAAPISDVANDNILYVQFDEIGGAVYDTGAMPNLTTTAAPGLRDFRNNPMEQVQDTADIERDRAAPIITAASGVTGHTGMSIQFSEPVDVNGSGGACNIDQISTASFVYTDSGNGNASTIVSMDADINACDDNRVGAILNSNLVVGDLNADQVRPATNAIRDMNDNAADSARMTAVTGAISPYVLGAYGNLKRKIRVAFSEAVDGSAGAAGACNHANYLLIEDPVESGCSGGGTDVIAIDTTAPIVEISPDVYEITTTAAQCSSTTYRLTVSNVIDRNESVPIIDPKYATFMGNEQLMVASASCLTTTSMMVVFNKAVVAGTSTGGSELNTRYNFNTTLLMLNASKAPSAATRGTGANTNRVTLVNTKEQSGATFMVIGSNGTNGDGFDDASVGPIQTLDESPQEDLQQSPKDRAPWVGCGDPITDFNGGPIAVDPFGDGSDFGFLAAYHNKVYIGPNRNGNMANRMEPDGSLPTNCYFTFTKDTETANSTETHENGAAGIPPARFRTIGHTGCTTNSADINLGCGPDNENGRGLFVNGTVGGTEYLFITGGKSTGNNDYLYQTTDTDTTLDFSFVDLSATFNSDSIEGNKGTESIVVFNNKVYWMEPGNLDYRPYFVKLNNLNAQSASGSDSGWMYIRYMSGMGNWNSKPNRADRIGGTLYAFNDRLYLANNGSVRNTSDGNYDDIRPGCNATTEDSYGSGCGFLGLFACHNTCINDGGIIRSTNNDPAPCSGQNNCTGWTDITPSGNAKYTNYFSKVITKLADVIPANRPVPAFTEFNGNLYMIRNACTTNVINTECTPNGFNSCTDDISCPSGSEVPQLWKCVPGVDGECDSGDWSLVAENGTTGRSNMGDTENKFATLLIANGNHLYMGFDNANGVEIWMTKDGVTNPASASDFEQTGSNGLGDPSSYKSLWSAISVQGSDGYYIYVSVGNGVVPVAIFRQRND